jgi:hypothetical protein
MKKFVPLSLQANRVRSGNYASDESYGLAGAFKLLGPGPESTLLLVLSSGPESNGNDTGWEHVSVSAERRPPTWTEMCFVKDLFWSETECVIQYHPPKNEYVNFHPNVLHMWKPISMTIPMPPLILVGPRR